MDDISLSLGKRKERDDESANHGATLFVSNLPYTATSVDLQTVFSDIAPVRSAFVVTQQGTGVSKGVGYVAFAIKEDAQAAFEKLSQEGMILAGRALRIQWAEHKPKEDKDATVQQPVIKRTAKEPRPRPALDPLAIRTIVVNGLPTSVDSKSTLWKKFRKYSGAECLEWPVDGSSAHVVFSTPSAAHAALEKLHAHIYKGSILSVTLKKRLDALSKNKASAQPSHASRLIVRNIPFHTTEQDLRSVFLPYGPVHSIHIPRNKDDGRMRGFAFVWMLSKKDAERAMESCNGITLRPGLAESLASDKQKRKKQRRLEKKAQGQPVEDEEEAEAAEEVSPERTIAVDWALSKDKWEEEKSRMVAEDGVSSDSGSDSEDDSDSGQSQLGVHEGAEDKAEDEAEEEREDEPVKPHLPDTDVGTTLFIRNIPFAATEDELRILFRPFGRLRYARISVDPYSGRSRGTGFACFWEKDDSDKVIEQSDLLKMETTGTAPVIKKNPFVLPSILTPDPSSSLARSLVLHGRTLDVVRAVTRDVASKLKEQGERKREKADKRNMYLLREGVILPNSPAAQTMPSAELERRSASFTARRTLLNSNPSLYVSKTRLSIRQIPLFASEKVLKKLALHAAREFEKDVKGGVRNGLTEDELVVDRDMQESEEGKEAKGKKHGNARDRVKQAKIVRQNERVDPVTGKGRSKGYGFVEMHSHSDALRVLRWANNNVTVGKLLVNWYKEELAVLVTAEKGKKKEEREDGRLKRLQDASENGAPVVKGTLIVEFSIENVQVVQRRAAYQNTRDKPDTGKVNGKRKKVHDEDINDKSEEASRPGKKAKMESRVPMTEKKAVSTVGALIGRKRKERKAKK